MHWMWHTFGLVTIWFVVVGALCVWCFAWDFLGVIAHVLIYLIPPLRFKPEVRDRLQPHLHWQSASFGQDWGFGWNYDGRRMFFFHSYMGWKNLSEMHNSRHCDDSAYCPWHGSL